MTNLSQSYETELATLETMGFTNRIENRRVLQITNGNIEQAITYLIR